MARRDRETRREAGQRGDMLETRRWLIVERELLNWPEADRGRLRRHFQATQAIVDKHFDAPPRTRPSRIASKGPRRFG